MAGEYDFSRASIPARGLSDLHNPETIYRALSDAGVGSLYPCFDNWFATKVIPGLRSGERRILTSVVHGKLAGVAICKRSIFEAKLCTLWVSPEARCLGIASDIACDAFAWLGTDKPLFTVPEERLSEFGRLLSEWGFTKHFEHLGLYRSGRVEHVFNDRKA